MLYTLYDRCLCIFICLPLTSHSEKGNHLNRVAPVFPTCVYKVVQFHYSLRAADARQLSPRVLTISFNLGMMLPLTHAQAGR